jgi:hypothetical protein
MNAEGIFIEQVTKNGEFAPPGYEMKELLDAMYSRNLR